MNCVEKELYDAIEVFLEESVSAKEGDRVRIPHIIALRSANAAYADAKAEA